MDPNHLNYFQNMLQSPNSPNISQSENNPYSSQHPTFSDNPNTSLDPNELYNPYPILDPTFSTQCSIGVEASAKPKKNQRAKRNTWSIEDDTVLVSAYLNTSKDSIIGIDQSSTCFWSKITTYYNENKTGGVIRDEKACKNRWHVVNGQVSKFVGFYTKATACKKSGESESDVILAAHTIYEIELKKKFNLEHAWYLLRNDPKWSSMGEDSSYKRMRLNEQGNYSSSSSTGTPSMPTTPGTPGTPMYTPTDFPTPDPVLIRPIGAKAAKRKAKEKVQAMPSLVEGVIEGSASATERMRYITELVDSQNNLAEAMKATARAKEATARAKQYRSYLKLAAKDNRSVHEERALAALDAELFPTDV